MIKMYWLVVIASFLFCQSVYAEDKLAPETGQASKPTAVSETIQAPVPKQDSSQNKISTVNVFSNFTIGIGVFTFMHDEIVDAEIVNGTVHVKEKRAMRASPWLQTGWICDTCWKEWIRPGFFVGAALFSGDQTIGTVGLGLNLAFPRTKQKNPIYFGVGIHWSSIQRLASGFEDGQPIPTGAENILYRKETEPGLMFNIAFEL